MFALALLVAGSGLVAASASSTTPQYFQTKPELFAGATATGAPPLLAQTNPAPFPSVSYVPPQPLETQEPISGAPKHGNIFDIMGVLTPYRPNSAGFGVEEYPLPEGAEIVQLHMLHRHGARYLNSPSGTLKKLENTKFHATGELAFLNSWKNKLGLAMLVPIGKQELFDSGTQHQYSYGHLYPNDGTKIIARSTTQDRMTQSAEYFLAGFFGLEWPKNASIELIIDKERFNNSLSGSHACPNTQKPAAQSGIQVVNTWVNIYLKDAYQRLKKCIEFDSGDDNIELTIEDVYFFQSMCSYETVALGYSTFCQLFTYEEWQGFNYATDLVMSGSHAFGSPTGRAVGIGWVQELRARLQGHYLTTNAGPANTTLDSMPDTFPLNQSLYFDFTHDTTIIGILTAMGLTQFNEYLPPTKIVPRELSASRLVPFAARLDIEIISASKPVPASRRLPVSPDQEQIPMGGATSKQTKYVHMLLNQRTIPLGRSFKQCGDRDDGWCELDEFLEATASAYKDSDYEFACFGDYPAVPYGEVTNGAPNKAQHKAAASSNGK